MILAALDALYSIVFEIIDSSSDPNAIRRLRQISRTHVAYSLSRRDTLVLPFIGFVASPIDLGYLEELGVRQQAAIDALAGTIEEGKRQGSVLQDVDSEQAAWELVAAYWADVLSLGIGLRQFADKERTVRMLDFILDSIATESQREEDSALEAIASVP